MGVILGLDLGTRTLGLSLSDTTFTIASTLKTIRFNENDVRTMGRDSQGVRSMKLSEDDYIIDMVVAKENSQIITVSSQGYAKRSDIKEFRLQGRGGMGVKAGVFNEKTGKVVALRPITAENDILAISADGVMIRTHAESINVVGRTSLGVRLMKVSAQDKVVSVSVVDKQEDEEIETIEQVEEENN